ncbi:MAG: polysaccharide biosynthesis tyrosine autokinase, partial [Alphaproteobacteria bacterium]
TRVETTKIALKAQLSLMEERKPTGSQPADMELLKRDFIYAEPLVSVLSERIIQMEQDKLMSQVKWRKNAPALQQIDRAIANLKASLEEAKKKAGREFEEMITTKQKLLQTKRVDDLKTGLAQLEARETRLSEMLDKQNKQTVKLGRKGVAIQKLKDEMAFTRDLYQATRQRIQELQVERRRPARIRVAISADVPTLPSRDKRVKYSVVLVMGALLFGCAFTIFLYQMDLKVEAPVDVEARHGLRVLGTTPRLQDLARDRVQPNHFVDDCRTIWVNLALADSKRSSRVLVIASPEGRDGKTTFAINLATSVAMMGKRVLLIDADVRKPEIARYLRMKDAPGLTDLLADQCAPRDAIHKTPIESLNIMPSNRAAGQSGEILTHEKIETILRELNPSYDEIIIDTPAVLAMPDGKLWAAHSDAVLLVARSGKTAAKDLEEAHVRMKQTGAKIMGVVLTGVRVRDSYERYSQRYSASEWMSEPSGKGRRGKSVFIIDSHAAPAPGRDAPDNKA